MATGTSKSSKVTSLSRQNQFPHDFKPIGTGLMCIVCNHEVDWEKKSTLRNHLSSSKHIEIKTISGVIKPQATLHETVTLADKKQDIILDFVEMMVQCNIPLGKKDNDQLAQ